MDVVNTFNLDKIALKDERVAKLVAASRQRQDAPVQEAAMNLIGALGYKAA
jgi:hypothetical protein